MSAQTSDAMILGSNLISFLPGVSKADRADVLDALLLAELSASRRHDRHKEWEAWINAYKTVLIGTGLTTQSALASKPVTVRNERGFRREAAKLLGMISSRQLADVAESALEQMFNSTNARTFFKSWFAFSAGRFDSFQVVPCVQTAEGVIDIAACGLAMQTRTKTRLPLFGIIQNPFHYEMTITFRGGGFVYNRDTYAQHRERMR